MSGIPRLAEVLAEHVPDMEKSCWANERWCKGCQTVSRRIWPWSDFPKHQADAWYQACQITTVAQLDALPDFVVLRANLGEIWEKEHHGNEGPWWRTGDGGNQYGSSDIRLPALLLWSPEWTQP